MARSGVGGVARSTSEDSSEEMEGLGDGVRLEADVSVGVSAASGGSAVSSAGAPSEADWDTSGMVWG